MTATSTDTRKPAPLGRRILGSFVPPFVSWVAFNLLYLIAAFFLWPSPSWWVGPVIAAMFSGSFIFGTWLLILLPLYLLVPERSVLWRWPLCTFCGALAGAGIIVVWSSIYYPQATDRIGMSVIAAVIGGVTCLVGSLTRHRFQHARTA